MYFHTFFTCIFIFITIDSITLVYINTWDLTAPMCSSEASAFLIHLTPMLFHLQLLQDNIMVTKLLSLMSLSAFLVRCQLLFIYWINAFKKQKNKQKKNKHLNVIKRNSSESLICEFWIRWVFSKPTHTNK